MLDPYLLEIANGIHLNFSLQIRELGNDRAPEEVFEFMLGAPLARHAEGLGRRTRVAPKRSGAPGPTMDCTIVFPSPSHLGGVKVQDLPMNSPQSVLLFAGPFDDTA